MFSHEHSFSGPFQSAQGLCGQVDCHPCLRHGTVCFVSNCRWEVGDVSSNIGETVLSYQTMKYKFNYTSLVKFLNFMVWYDNNEDFHAGEAVRFTFAAAKSLH